MQDFEDAKDKVMLGVERKSLVLSEDERRLTAYHEAGHTVVSLTTEGSDPIHKVTIVPMGHALGATMSLPEKDRSNLSKKWCVATIKTCFGGRIAEEMFCGDINTGALGDIRQATGLVRRMIRDWGMNDRLGFVFYGEEENHPAGFHDFGVGGKREYSEETARAIDEEVKKLIDGLYEETRQLLSTAEGPTANVVVGVPCRGLFRDSAEEFRACLKTGQTTDNRAHTIDILIPRILT
jgi:cell division protease FtsH